MQDLLSTAPGNALKGFWFGYLAQHRAPCLVGLEQAKQLLHGAPAASIFSRADVLNCSALMVSGKGSSPSPSTCHDTMHSEIKRLPELI